MSDDTATDEARNAVEAEAPKLDSTVITGKSGRTYRAVDLFDEMTGDQEEVVADLIAPILEPLTALAKRSAEGTAPDAAMVVSMAEVASAIVRYRLHRQLIAVVYLPTDDREFRIADVDERIADLKHLTVSAAIAVLLDFFGGAASSFQNIFSGSFGAMTSATNGGAEAAANGTNSPTKKRLK